MTIRVELAERSYEVFVGPGVRHQLTEVVARVVPEARVALIVAPASLQQLKWFDIATGLEQHVLEIPEGEAAKDFATLAFLSSEFSRRGLSRRDVVVSVGGGATTDVVGFAAAAYLRGVAVIHVATSLVAQVDAAIGGKTGINIPLGKNLVGAFHQPRAVFCDSEVLQTLPERERQCGRGEIAKCWILEGRSVADLARSTLEEQIVQSVALKSRIVSGDEREGGERALLNYGHTLAHALEAQSLAGRSLDLRHGEAVAIGIAFAVRLSRRLGLVGDVDVKYQDDVLDTLGLPRQLPTGLSIDELLLAMARDKKAHHDLTFVLATTDGFQTVANISASTVREELEAAGGVS